MNNRYFDILHLYLFDFIKLASFVRILTSICKFNETYKVYNKLEDGTK